MLSDEEKDQLLQLLSTHRRTVGHLLNNIALQGGKTYALPGVLNSLEEARREIDKIKKYLRSHGIQVDDWIYDYEIIAPESVISHVRLSRSGDAAAFTKLACQFIQDNQLPVDALTLLNDHSYWLVRKLAIEQIIKSGGDSTLNLLFEFRNTSYFVSQNYIREYLESSCDNGHLNEDQRQKALEILSGLSNAPKVTAKSRQKNDELALRLAQGCP